MRLQPFRLVFDIFEVAGSIPAMSSFLLGCFFFNRTFFEEPCYKGWTTRAWVGICSLGIHSAVFQAGKRLGIQTCPINQI